MVTRVRIGRVVLPGVARGDAAATEAALRAELARLAAGVVPEMVAGGTARVQVGPLGAATPAGRGREAAGRILSSLAGAGLGGSRMGGPRSEGGR